MIGLTCRLVIVPEYVIILQLPCIGVPARLRAGESETSRAVGETIVAGWSSGGSPT
jgi:hypothetical protein